MLEVSLLGCSMCDASVGHIWNWSPALCIPGMSPLCHPGCSWGLVVPFPDEAPALCTPARGQTAGGDPAGDPQYVLGQVGPVAS